MAASPERLDRVFKAAREALGRLRGLSGSDPATRFAPLGEVLMWLVAADDVLEAHDSKYKSSRDGDPVGRRLKGIRFARNHAVHGLEVGALAAARSTSSLPATIPFVLGGSKIVWIPNSLVPPAPRNQGESLRQPYELHLEGRDVLPLLDEALDYLEARAKSQGLMT